MMDIVWEVGAAGTTLACISMRKSESYMLLNNK
jgi:hypothetical protein